MQWHYSTSFAASTATVGSFPPSFDWNGSLLEGDKRIVVHVHADKEKAPNEWYYSILPIEGYGFIRIPVNASAVIESLGRIEGVQTADADYFRYFEVPDGLMRLGGPTPNGRFVLRLALWYSHTRNRIFCLFGKMNTVGHSG
jgi:hypothetical protein